MANSPPTSPVVLDRNGAYRVPPCRATVSKFLMAGYALSVETSPISKPSAVASITRMRGVWTKAHLAGGKNTNVIT